jgi:hypothetical protein
MLVTARNTNIGALMRLSADSEISTRTLYGWRTHVHVRRLRSMTLSSLKSDVAGKFDMRLEPGDRQRHFCRK